MSLCVILQVPPVPSLSIVPLSVATGMGMCVLCVYVLCVCTTSPYLNLYTTPRWWWRGWTDAHTHNTHWMQTHVHTDTHTHHIHRHAHISQHTCTLYAHTHTTCTHHIHVYTHVHTNIHVHMFPPLHSGCVLC